MEGPALVLARVEVGLESDGQGLVVPQRGQGCLGNPPAVIRQREFVDHPPGAGHDSKALLRASLPSAEKLLFFFFFFY